MEQDLGERFRENAIGIAALIVTGTWLAATTAVDLVFRTRVPIALGETREVKHRDRPARTCRESNTTLNSSSRLF